MRKRSYLFAILTAILVVSVLTESEALSAPADHGDGSSPVSVVDGDNTPLMLEEPVSDLPVVDDARWSSTLTHNTLIALLWWLVVLFALYFAGLPWAVMLLRQFGARASGFAILIAWLLSSWFVWLLSSLNIIAFRAVWCAVAVASVALVGWLWRTRSFPESSHRSDVRDSLTGGPQAAFVAVFTLFLAYRFVNPDSWHPSWGGEKPMEFAHINAILRSAHFPPFDPWFSGGILNYYYYGSYLVAFLMKLTGIPSEIAFNLAQPTVMALLGAGTYSVVSVLASDAGGRRAARVGGVIGVIVLLLMGNLVAAKNFIELLPKMPHPTFNEWTWAPSRAIAGAITEFPYFTGLYADLHAHVVALPITVLVIAGGLEFALRGNLPPQTVRQFLRDQTPLVLVLALAVGALSATNAWDVPLYAVLVAASIWLAAVSLGSISHTLLATVLLSAIALMAGALAFLPFHRHYVALFSSVDEVRTTTSVAEWSLHVGGLLLLATIGLVWVALNRPAGPAEVTPGRAGLFAIGAALASSALALFVQRRLDTTGESALGSSIAVIGLLLLTAWLIASRLRVSGWVFGGVGVAIVALTPIAANGWVVLAIGAAMAILGAALWYFPFSGSLRFTGLLLAAAGSAVAALELLFVVDDLAPDRVYYRMNTMFKIYNEVWITLGIAAAALAARCVVAAVDYLDAGSLNRATELQCDADLCFERPASHPLAVSVPLALLAVSVVTAGLVYPVLATEPRLDERFSGHPGPKTLNALNWMDYGTIATANGDVIRFDGDRAAIDWFNTEIAGTPVIAEASIGPYRGNGSRISNATGLPTVLGWFRHQLQQRYEGDLEARYLDLLTLYNAMEPADAMNIIDRYEIEYIVVGDVERFTIIDESSGRTYASPAGLATLESMVGTALTVAFESGDTVVYQVAESRS